MRTPRTLAYPRRPLYLALALAAAVAIGSIAVSGIPAPAFSLGWYGDGLCDDAEALNPGAPGGCRYGAEAACDNAIDDDSDEKTDCLDSDCPTCPTACPKTERDGDGDCELDEGWTFFTSACENSSDDDGDTATDCADSDCATWPSCLPEICRNGLDDNGNGQTDCSDSSCSSSGECYQCILNPNPENCDPICVGKAEICGDGIDQDCDGRDRPCGGADEVCDDGRDNDGDGLADCDDRDCAANIACPIIFCGNGNCDPGETCAGCSIDCGPCGTEMCDNGLDDDGDTSVDCIDSDCADDPACEIGCDPCDISGGCYSLCTCNPSDPICMGEIEVCDNGADDDSDSKIDCADPDCSADEFCASEKYCSDLADNDEDGNTDCADSDCYSDWNCDWGCDDPGACNYGDSGSCSYDCCPDENDDGLNDETGDSCNPRTCVVVVVEGINSSGSFGAAVSQIESEERVSVKGWHKMGATNDPDAQGAAVESILSGLYGNADHDEKILVVAHSLGSVAMFNMKNKQGGSYPDTTFLYYDPPYNYPGSGAPWSVFSKVLSAIRAARSGGIAGSVTDDWTGGYDEPGEDAEHSTNSFQVAEDTAHNMFETRPSLLWQVNSWMRDCPKAN